MNAATPVLALLAEVEYAFATAKLYTLTLPDEPTPYGYKTVVEIDGKEANVDYWYGPTEGKATVIEATEKLIDLTFAQMGN